MSSSALKTRVYDLTQTQQGVIRKIPFAQLICHEGHYPFRRKANWAPGDGDLPLCFSPNAEAYNDTCEWMRYDFNEEDEKELQEVPTPGGVDFKLAPEEMNYRYRKPATKKPARASIKVPHPPPPPDLPSVQPSQARTGPAGSAAQSQSPDHSVIDLSVDDDDDLPPLDDADGHEEGDDWTPTD